MDTVVDVGIHFGTKFKSKNNNFMFIFILGVKELAKKKH